VLLASIFMAKARAGRRWRDWGFVAKLVRAPKKKSGRGSHCPKDPRKLVESYYGPS
jgi:hypothetical protein